MAKQDKTNVMRLLEQKKIPYKMHDYSRKELNPVRLKFKSSGTSVRFSS